VSLIRRTHSRLAAQLFDNVHRQITMSKLDDMSVAELLHLIDSVIHNCNDGMLYSLYIVLFLIQI
jgi:hypothetical protein